MTMRRILHVIDSLDYTGSASQLLMLAKRLAQDGFDVHVCALAARSPRLEEFAAAGIETASIPRRWSVDPLSNWQLVRHLRRLQPDVVHTWDTLAGTIAPTAMGLRLVAGQYRIERWKLQSQWALQRRLGVRAGQCVTSSESVRDWCVENGLPPERLMVIPSGIESGRASDLSRDALTRHLGLPLCAKLIGVVGRLVPEKRVKDLIWAADLLRVLHDNLRLLVIGDGPLRTQLEEYARLASDLDHIRFLGEGNDAWRIMPHLDVLWNGGDNVGHSAAILEAMAAGVPVIASDTATNRELVTHGETGYLIPLGTRAGRAARARFTDRLFSDLHLHTRLSTASRNRAAQNFSAANTSMRYAELYTSTAS